jgi:hypothetical protein
MASYLPMNICSPSLGNMETSDACFSSGCSGPAFCVWDIEGFLAMWTLLVKARLGSELRFQNDYLISEPLDLRR